MKIVQTLWTGNPKASSNPLDIKCGWRFGEYHWMSWCLSCLQLRAFYPRVELVTDKLGKEILVDIFKLPYTDVSTALEGKMSDYPPELWSMAKIFSYNEQTEPFVHMDGDVFLWKPISNSLLSASVIAQNLEVNLPYYETAFKEILLHFHFIPECLNKIQANGNSIRSANTGIFGGTDLPFIKAYCKAAFEFVSVNFNDLGKINKGNFNAVYEQCLLYYFAQDRKVCISYFRKEPVTDPAYLNYANFIDIPQTDIIHPVGGYKTMPYVCNQLAKQLRKQYPEWYYTIIDVYRKNKGTTERKIYSLPPFNTVDFYPGIFNLEKTYYQTNSKSKVAEKRNDLAIEQFDIQGKQMFCRTASVLDMLNKKSVAGGRSYEQRRLVSEIFNLEYRKFMLTKQLKNLRGLIGLYFNELIEDEATYKAFNSSRHDILEIKIAMNSRVELHKLRWNWDPMAIANVIVNLNATNRPGKGNGCYVLLSPDHISLRVNEIYPDALDTAVLKICKRPVRIGDVVKKIEPCFDADDIGERYELFEDLLVNTIKRICYAGYLRIA